MFLPTTKAGIEVLGWDQPDMILVTGDVYIDSPYIGIAIIGQVLADAGFRVGIIAQPDLNSAADISRLGEPQTLVGRYLRLGRLDGSQLYRPQKTSPSG